MSHPFPIHLPRGHSSTLQQDPLATSRWFDPGTAIQSFGYDPQRTDGIFLGYLPNGRGRTYLSVPIDDRHLVTIAGARSGKISLNRSLTAAPLLRSDEVRMGFAQSSQSALVLMPGAHPLALCRSNYFDPIHSMIFGGQYE